MGKKRKKSFFGSERDESGQNEEIENLVDFVEDADLRGGKRQTQDESRDTQSRVRTRLAGPAR